MGDNHNKIIITKQSTEAETVRRRMGERGREAYTPSRNLKVSRGVAHELIATDCGAFDGQHMPTVFAKI